MKSLVDFVSRSTTHNDIHLSKAIFFTSWVQLTIETERHKEAHDQTCLNRMLTKFKIYMTSS